MVTYTIDQHTALFDPTSMSNIATPNVQLNLFNHFVYLSIGRCGVLHGAKRRAVFVFFFGLSSSVVFFTVLSSLLCLAESWSLSCYSSLVYHVVGYLTVSHSPSKAMFICVHNIQRPKWHINTRWHYLYMSMLCRIRMRIDGGILDARRMLPPDINTQIGRVGDGGNAGLRKGGI